VSSESSEVTPNFEYQVALSFAGEERDYVQVVAEGLTRLGITHFLDSENEEDLWGKNLPEYFDWVFSRGSEYVVVFVSEHYAAKSWTRLELRSAVARALLEKNEYILPVRFDQAHLDGIPDTTCYIDLEGKTPERLAAMIANKVRRRSPVQQEAATVSEVRPEPHADSITDSVLEFLASRLQEAALTTRLITESQRIIDAIPPALEDLKISSKEDTTRFLESIAKLVSPLADAVATLSYFGDEKSVGLTVDPIERLGQTCLVQEQNHESGGIAYLPATLVSYSALCGACLHRNLDVLPSVLLKPQLFEGDGARLHWFTQFNTLTTFGLLENQKLTPGTYISQYGGGLLIQGFLESLPFADLASHKDKFRVAFEMVEYSVGLLGQAFKAESSRWNVPAGTLAYYFSERCPERGRRAFEENVADYNLQRAFERQGMDKETWIVAERGFLNNLQRYGRQIIW